MLKPEYKLTSRLDFQSTQFADYFPRTELERYGPIRDWLWGKINSKKERGRKTSLLIFTFPFSLSLSLSCILKPAGLDNY